MLNFLALPSSHSPAPRCFQTARASGQIRGLPAVWLRGTSPGSASETAARPQGPEHHQADQGRRQGQSPGEECWSGGGDWMSGVCHTVQVAHWLNPGALLSNCWMSNCMLSYYTLPDCLLSRCLLSLSYCPTSYCLAAVVPTAYCPTAHCLAAYCLNACLPSLCPIVRLSAGLSGLFVGVWSHLFPPNLGGSARILDKVHPISAVRHISQLNWSSASNSS